MPGLVTHPSAGAPSLMRFCPSEILFMAFQELYLGWTFRIGGWREGGGEREGKKEKKEGREGGRKEGSKEGREGGRKNEQKERRKEKRKKDEPEPDQAFGYIN